MGMKESDYLLATNKAKTEAALKILRDVLPGDEYGVSEAELVEITKPLSMLLDKLYAQIETHEG